MVKMTENASKIEWLENPEIFAVNKLPAHSDHKYYQTYKEEQTVEI